jgi:hypothetical protein
MAGHQGAPASRGEEVIVFILALAALAFAVESDGLRQQVWFSISWVLGLAAVVAWL